MCEILLRVVNKVNVDPYLDCKLLKRGDVVVIQPDAWGWSVAEKTNPDWRIVKVPGISVDLVTAFIAPELPVDPLNPSRVLQRRAFSFDLSKLTGAPLAYLNDNTRSSPSYTLSANLTQLLALKLAKVALVDPNILV